MADVIDRVVLSVETTAGASSDNISKLVTQLQALKTSTSGSYRNISNLSKYLNSLKESAKGMATTSKNLKSLESLSTSLSSLTNMGDTKNLRSLMKELSKLPEIAQALDDSTISEFVTKIDKLTQSLTPLATQVEKITVGFNKLPSKINAVNKYLDKNNKKIKNGTSLWSAFTKGLSGAIVKFRIITDNIKDVVRGVTDIIDKATSYEEALNLFAVSMGSQAEDATKWVEMFSNALYLDSSNVMQYMGSLNSLIGGLGVGAEKSYLMSKNLTQLAYDLASFKNMKFEEAFTKLQSGISGEIEPLRNVGVALSQNTLQELATSLGIKQRVAEMSEAQKAQLRYIQIIKSTTQWQGDMGRTLMTPANALRVVREQFTLLARAVGQVFLPIVMEAIPYVMALTEVLTDLAKKLSQMLGYKPTEINYNSLKNITSTITGIGEEADKTTDKLNTMLAPFDELNVVQNQSKSGTGGLGIGGDLGLNLPEYDALSGLTKEMSNSIATAKDNLEKFLEIASKATIVLGVLWSVDKLNKFASFLKGLFVTTDGGLTIFGKLGKKVVDLVKNFTKTLKNTKSLTETFKKLFPWLTKTKVGILGVASGFLASYDASKKVANGTKDVDTQIKKFWASTATATVAGALIAGPWGALAGVIGSIGASLIGLGKGYDELQSKLATEDLFGTLNISTASFKDMLSSAGPALDITNEKIESLSESIKNNGDAFQNNLSQVENYLYRFGTLGQTITDEYDVEITSALSSLFDNANNIIDDGTERSLEIWTSTFKGMTSVTVEEQQSILNNIRENGEYQKQVIESAEKRINEIYKNASDDRRKLNQEEVDEINELLKKIDELTVRQVTDSEVELYTIRQKFSDKNLELDKESYTNYKNALQEYQDERTKVINKNYLQAEADADAHYSIMLDKLKAQGVSEEDAIKSAQDEKNKMLDIAKKRQEQDIKDMQTYINTQNELVLGTLKQRYLDLANETDPMSKKQRGYIESIFKEIDPSMLDKLKKQIANAGKDSGKDFSNNFNKNLKTPTLTIETKGNMLQFNKEFYGYANGGFPQTGEFFMARENGPEMVGRIGNQTAVANNDQITTSITNALITALNSYGFGNNQPGTTVVNIGGNKVYEGVGDYVDSENDRYGTNYINV